MKKTVSQSEEDANKNLTRFMAAMSDFGQKVRQSSLLVQQTIDARELSQLREQLTTWLQPLQPFVRQSQSVVRHFLRHVRRNPKRYMGMAASAIAAVFITRYIVARRPRE